MKPGMKVTIELQDHEVKFLSKWASVSRTLTTARQLLMEFPPTDEATEDKIGMCEDELKDLTTPLDQLHSRVRDQIWIQLRDRKE